MRFSDEAKNVMLNALDESVADGITHLSLHTAYSSTGANEVTGGSPAYARQAVVWGAAASGSKAMTGTEQFDIPAGTTVRWIGGWDAVSAGDFKGMTPNGGGTPEAFTVPVIADDTLEAPGHGFSNAQTVVVWAVPGVALPTGLAEGTVYHVRDATTDDLKLAATAGGAAIDISAVGSGFLQRIVEETFGAQGTHTVSALSLSLN